MNIENIKNYTPCQLYERIPFINQFTDDKEFISDCYYLTYEQLFRAYRISVFPFVSSSPSDWAYRPSFRISRASSGVATSMPSSRMMRTARSTIWALLLSSSPGA